MKQEGRKEGRKDGWKECLCVLCTVVTRCVSACGHTLFFAHGENCESRSAAAVAAGPQRDYSFAQVGRGGGGNLERRLCTTVTGTHCDTSARNATLHLRCDTVGVPACVVHSCHSVCVSTFGHTLFFFLRQGIDCVSRSAADVAARPFPKGVTQ